METSEREQLNNPVERVKEIAHAILDEKNIKYDKFYTQVTEIKDRNKVQYYRVSLKENTDKGFAVYWTIEISPDFEVLRTIEP